MHMMAHGQVDSIRISTRENVPDRTERNHYRIWRVPRLAAHEAMDTEKNWRYAWLKLYAYLCGPRQGVLRDSPTGREPFPYGVLRLATFGARGVP